MVPISLELAQRVSAALEVAFGEAGARVDPLIRLAQNPQFGDYQANCAMALAKQIGAKPRDVAGKIVQAIDVAGLADPPAIAGPGFINFRLTAEAVASRLQSIAPVPKSGPDSLGIEPATDPITVAVDMSSVNLAKEMHIGHLRSAVIGDCVARILEFVGHRVERINHVGDWGTQFGMLVAHLRAASPDALSDLDHLAVADLEAFYIEAKRNFDVDADFAEQARKTVVLLQGGDPDTLAVWRGFCDESLRHCRTIHDRLGITDLIDRGESFYNDVLATVVEELTQRGMVEKSEGADCVFLDGFVARDKKPLPMMIRKSDGGYNYATTDLAAARHRLRELGARRLIYVVGVPQKHHFAMLFAALRKAGWAGDDVRLEHLAFGSMLGGDGRPFKTRVGGTVKLKSLLDEAVARARRVVKSGEEAEAGKRPVLSSEEADRIAETVGIAALKYFDLSHNLTTDYRFDWDTMLSLEGNTAPYMLYAYARIRSIGRKAGIDYTDLPDEAELLLEHEAELKLAKALLRLPEVIATVAGDLRPNLLTDYLFELSKAFSQFYDRVRGVRVIDAPEPQRTSRLRLCDLTARTLRVCLGLLGIDTLEQM
ncbi:MAG: arginine--tRNA ligase [bacterium]|nr:arginine--tRNA ligase [bacterium]